MSTGERKKLMYLNRRAPCGTIYAVEGLEVVLIGAAFDQDVCMAFVGDGVYQLKAGQDTSGSDMKNFSPAYRALGGLRRDEALRRTRVAGGARPGRG